jgi:hypothetical protein
MNVVVPYFKILTEFYCCDFFGFHSPYKNATECSGTLFYHWGALNGLIGMIEDGYWK